MTEIEEARVCDFIKIKDVDGDVYVIRKTAIDGYVEKEGASRCSGGVIELYSFNVTLLFFKERVIITKQNIGELLK
ncbi:hypothetical protein KAR91_26535 [Candidatus Pacearchaeota archaeon]|nr:hypothetical protein [Candidatus Pacearchaeota archaeon]